MATSTRQRRWRIGVGLLLLIGMMALLLVMPWWREHQLRISCEQGHGRWKAEAQSCTFGGSMDTSADAKSSTNTPPAPEPK